MFAILSVLFTLVTKIAKFVFVFLAFAGFLAMVLWAFPKISAFYTWLPTEFLVFLGCFIACAVFKAVIKR